MTQQDQEQEGSTMVDQQQGQEKKGPTMERRKTMTMTWEGLGDDDDDAFFETRDRLSTAVPIDLLSSEDDDEDYDDSRASFASAMSAMDDFQRTSFEEAVRQAPVATMFGNYDMWMAEPGSIKDRRKKLLQGMGLASNKNLLSTKFMHVVSEKIAANAAADQPPKTAAAATAKAAPPSTTAVPSESASPPDGTKQEVLTTMPRVMLVRSRSDGDIETFSAQTRSRKEELIGNVSKQRLTRTSSVLLTSQAGICLYANAVNVEPKSSARNRSSIPNSAALLDTQFGAFFLIKNLDTGKEFIVKEFNNDGMWNRLSEVQTGKQLTMEEFEKSVGYSPVVKELMRRAHVDEVRKGNVNSYLSKSFRYSKKRGVSLLKNIKGVATSVSGLIAEKEREQQLQQQQQQSSSPDKKNNKNSSSSSSSKWVKVRTHGKSIKDFSALHLCQEIQAHEGSIWTMKFSPDAHYLATAGEDRVIHVWEVQECDVMQANDLSSAGSTPVHPMVAGGSNSMDHRPNLGDASPLPSEKRKDRPPLPELSPMLSDKKKKGKFSNKKKGIPDYVHVPETVFSLSEKPICTFTGHQDDVLDLSWSKSQLLLSASMDKTVRLWDMETKSCLKLFAHNDYVTCIQFNPVDDNYFISGSLDEKVRIWSIPDRQLIDYTDLHEMVTSACYTPDGQGAIIGSHKGSCRLYSTAECRIEHKEQFELRRKKKSMLRKVTGFQYSPSNPSEILVTSADSRIRILDGSEIIHKFKGFKNTSSQISASFSPDGKHVISASEDSQVYIWKREGASGKGKGMIITQSHEHFHCKDVSVAIPWNGHVRGEPPVVEIHSKRHSKRSIPLPPSSIGSPTPDESGSKRLLPPLPKKNSMLERSTSCHDDDPSHISRTDSDSAIGAGDSFSSSSSSMRFGESPSISASGSSPSQSWSSRFEGGSGHGGGAHTVQATAWGLVIVTAGMEGEIRAYQNFGLPIKVGRL